MRAQIEDFPSYSIDTKGQVRNSQDYVLAWGSNGFYPKIVLLDKGRRKDKYIHRLVALAFIPNPENKSQVNHIDGNRLNNNVENLEWVTPSENQKHSYANGLNSRAGTNNGKAKLTEEDVKSIRFYFQYKIFTALELAKMCNVAEQTIRAVIDRKSWSHVL